MAGPSSRVSDEEREQMVVVLRGHLLAGRLTLDEFSERVGVAYGARTGSDLAVARQDLPDVPAPVASGRRKPVRFTGALFAHVVRRGRFALGRRTVIVGAFSDVDLDLREAAIGGARATVAIFVLFGNVDIYLPEGVAVDTAGVTVFGHRREWGREAAGTVAPAVKVRVLGSFATVDVWRVPAEMPGDYARIVRQMRRRERRLPPVSR